LSGCVSFPQDKVPFYASKEGMVACQAADVGTTWYALAHGAVEMNPLGIGLILVLKAVAIVGRYKYDQEINEQGAGITLNVISCLPVVNNLQVIRSLPK
jgi:hypothetical protein